MLSPSQKLIIRSTGIFVILYEKGCELEFARCFLVNFAYARCKISFFTKHFLIVPILYERSTLINFGFLIKEDFWYVVSILDFTGSNVCTTFIRIQNFSSILRKIQNSIKLEPFFRFWPNF